MEVVVVGGGRVVVVVVVVVVGAAVVVVVKGSSVVVSARGRAPDSSGMIRVGNSGRTGAGGGINGTVSSIAGATIATAGGGPYSDVGASGAISNGLNS